MPHIIFSHGNSFPASTYRAIFASLRARGFSVSAIEKFGHDSAYPVTNNWPHLVQQLADFAQAHRDKTGEPAYLVGHSLGGILSLMCAARHPGLAKGVLLLDSPILGGWKASTLGLAKKTALVGALSPGKVSSKRRNHWADTAAALAHFQHKKAFAMWEPTVLQDYIAYGTHDKNDERVLSFDRDIETAIYNTLPDNLDRLIKRQPVKCPVSFIGGTHSVEMRQVGMDLTRQVTKGRVMMLDGSHLFPMEKPLATAAAIEAALRNVGAAPAADSTQATD
jgi:pimeloyl-ACP methyl ester carboxylesterase